MDAAHVEDQQNICDMLFQAVAQRAGPSCPRHPRPHLPETGGEREDCQAQFGAGLPSASHVEDRDFAAMVDEGKSTAATFASHGVHHGLLITAFAHEHLSDLRCMRIGLPCQYITLSGVLVLAALEADSTGAAIADGTGAGDLAARSAGKGKMLSNAISAIACCSS